MTLSVNCAEAAPSGAKNWSRMNFKSPRAPNPLRIEKLNTISGTIENSVVYASSMARGLFSPGSQSRIRAAGYRATRRAGPHGGPMLREPVNNPVSRPSNHLNMYEPYKARGDWQD